MTRRQAENLAKGNPALQARLAAGEFDNPPGPAPRSSRAAPGRSRKPPVSAGAPPARPRARSGNSGSAPGASTRAPRRSRDNGDPPPARKGAIREFLDGLLGG